MRKLYTYSDQQEELNNSENILNKNLIDYITSCELRMEYLSFNDPNRYKRHVEKSLEETISKYDLTLLYFGILNRLYVSELAIDGNIILESFCGFLVKYGKLVRMTTWDFYNKLFDNQIFDELQNLIEDYYALFFILNNNVNDGDIERSFKDPDTAIRNRTHHVRGFGSGTQYIDEFVLITEKMNKKGRLQKFNRDYSLIPKGFLKLFKFRKIKNDKKSIGKYHFESIKAFYKFTNVTQRWFTMFYAFLHGKNWGRIIELIYLVRSHSLFSFDEFSDMFNDDFSKNRIDELFVKVGKNKDFDIWFNNILWKSPFIRINGMVFNPLYWVPLTFIEYTLINTLNSQEINVYRNVRTGEYFEKRIAEIIESKYSDITVNSGYEWYLDGDLSKKHETDILLMYKEYAFIIECKAGYIRENKLEGKYISDVIDTEIRAANKQGAKLQNEISKNNKINFYKNGQLVDEIDFLSYKVFTMGVSFEWLIYTSFGNSALNETDSRNKGHIHLNFIELMDVIEILDTPDQFFTYFHKRYLMEQSGLKILGDELDMIAFYLDQSFDFSKILLPDMNYVHLNGYWMKQADFNYFEIKYALNKEHPKMSRMLKKINKPRFIKNELFSRICSYIQSDEDYFSSFDLGLFESFPIQIQNKIQEVLINYGRINGGLIEYKLDDFSPKILFYVSKMNPLFTEGKMLLDNYSKQIDIIIACDFSKNLKIKKIIKL